MNLRQLQKRRGAKLRLRPLPTRRAANGTELEQADDLWHLEEVLPNPPSLRLVNLATGHVLSLQPDNVKEFRSPDFLLLRCQLTLTPTSVLVEPVFNEGDTFVRLEHQMPGLLAEMRQDLKNSRLGREIVLLQKSWHYWAKGNEFVYYFEDHADLLSKFQILENLELVTDITYGGNTTRYRMSEDLARHLGA